MKTDLRAISPNDLSAFLLAHGEKRFRTGQILRWLWKKGVTAIDQMNDLPTTTRELLQEYFYTRHATVAITRESRDRTAKLGICLHDSSLVEMIIIPSSRGATACLSTQVGCALRCQFCATGALGFTRDLDHAEIFDQVLVARDYLATRNTPLSNIVFMGMGEPLLNFDNVLAAIHYITAPTSLAISPSRVTLSTAGIPPAIRRLADENTRVHLAISLHSAIPTTRDRLMPVNKRYPLDQLSGAITYFAQKTGSRPTIEYLLLRDVNDSPADAIALARFCRAFPVKINIIEYNPVDHQLHAPSPPETRDRFVQILDNKNIIVNLRRSRGQDIDAACGQLANKLQS